MQEHIAEAFFLLLVFLVLLVLLVHLFSSFVCNVQVDEIIIREQQSFPKQPPRAITSPLKMNTMIHHHNDGGSVFVLVVSASSPHEEHHAVQHHL